MIDNTIRVATPEGVAFEICPAGLQARMLAFLLDTVIQFIGIFVAALLLIGIGAWLVLLVAFAIQWFYMTVFELSSDGRSVGKMALGLQVVMRDGSPVNAGASLIRNLLRALDFLPLVGILFPLFSRNFRRIGDLAASTLVIYAPRSRHVRTERVKSQNLVPRAAEKIVDDELVAALMSFSHRRESLGQMRRSELAQLALPHFVLDPESLINRELVTKTALSEERIMAIAAWYDEIGDTSKKKI